MTPKVDGEECNAKDPPETMKPSSKAGREESSDGMTREMREAVTEAEVKQSNTKDDHELSSTSDGEKRSKDDDRSCGSDDY